MTQIKIIGRIKRNKNLFFCKYDPALDQAIDNFKTARTVNLVSNNFIPIGNMGRHKSFRNVTVVDIISILKAFTIKTTSVKYLTSEIVTKSLLSINPNPTLWKLVGVDNFNLYFLASHG